MGNNDITEGCTRQLRWSIIVCNHTDGGHHLAPWISGWIQGTSSIKKSSKIVKAYVLWPSANIYKGEMALIQLPGRRARCPLDADFEKSWDVNHGVPVAPDWSICLTPPPKNPGRIPWRKSNVAMDNCAFTVDFPIQTSIYIWIFEIIAVGVMDGDNHDKTGDNHDKTQKLG